MYLSLSFLYRYNDIMTAGILTIIQNSVIMPSCLQIC